MTNSYSEERKYNLSAIEIRQVIERALRDIKTSQVSWSPNGNKVLILLEEDKRYEIASGLFAGEYGNICPHGAAVEISFNDNGQIFVKSATINYNLSDEQNVKDIFEKIENEIKSTPP